VAVSADRHRIESWNLIPCGSVAVRPTAWRRGWRCRKTSAASFGGPTVCGESTGRSSWRPWTRWILRPPQATVCRWKHTCAPGSRPRSPTPRAIC